MVTINATGREEPPKILAEDEEDHDGWGPIRPRRSGMPPDHADEHERDTIPLICSPHPDGQRDKR
jgi:hypothetical protein